MSEETAINDDIIAENVPEVPASPKMEKCGICGKVVRSGFGMKIHLNSHSPNKKAKMIPKGRLDLRGPRKKAAPIKTEQPAYARDAMKTLDQVKAPNEPWRPASILTASKKEGMRPRWVRKDLLEKRVEEGWQPRLADAKTRVESPEKTIVDGIPLGHYVTKRNMVLCDMPEEMAKSREDYYKKINEGGLAAQKRQFIGETIVGDKAYAYGDIKTEKD